MVLTVEKTEEDLQLEFLARVEAGEKIEAGDWMPEEYRVASN